MNVSPPKSSVMLGHKFLSYAKSRLPVANKPRTRRALLTVAPIPFAPLVDTHAFQPPPPYSVRGDDTGVCLRVPHNTPEASPRVPRQPRPIGLGLEGVEKGDGRRFDGLGRLSGGFKGSDPMRDEVHRMLSAQRRRAQTSEQPMKRHDVFYAPTRWDEVRRETVSSELKRAASLARRTSLRGSMHPWR